MEIKLKNIYLHNENDAVIILSLEAHYGWHGKNYGDIVKITYHDGKKDAHVSAKAKNPGVALVMKRIIETIKDIDFINIKDKAPTQLLLEELLSKLNLVIENPSLLQKVPDISIGTP